MLVTDDAGIAEINEQYLGRTGPTNVISFSMIEGDFSEVNPGQVLGDVIVSIETAHREAADAGMAADERFAELLIHGILHIFGYDHETRDADAGQMTEKADALMAMLREQNLIAR